MRDRAVGGLAGRGSSRGGSALAARLRRGFAGGGTAGSSSCGTAPLAGASAGGAARFGRRRGLPAPGPALWLAPGLPGSRLACFARRAAFARLTGCGLRGSSAATAASRGWPLTWAAGAASGSSRRANRPVRATGSGAGSPSAPVIRRDAM